MLDLALCRLRLRDLHVVVSQQRRSWEVRFIFCHVPARLRLRLVREQPTGRCRLGRCGCSKKLVQLRSSPLRIRPRQHHRAALAPALAPLRRVHSESKSKKTRKSTKTRPGSHPVGSISPIFKALRDLKHTTCESSSKYLLYAAPLTEPSSASLVRSF